MNTDIFSYGVLIPTADRADSLTRCIGSLLTQEGPAPCWVVLIDDGGLSAAELDAIRAPLAAAGTALQYYQKPLAERGLARSLAWAQQHLHPGASWCLILDDDIELLPGAVAALAAAAQDAAASIAAVGGYPINPPGAPPASAARVRFERWLGLAPGKPGYFCPAGFCESFAPSGPPIGPPGATQHVPGGFALWRRGVLEAVPFDKESYESYSLGVDQEYSCRVRAAGHQLLMQPAALAIHHRSRAGRAGAAAAGWRRGLARAQHQHRLFQRYFQHGALPGATGSASQFHRRLAALLLMLGATALAEGVRRGFASGAAWAQVGGFAYGWLLKRKAARRA